MTNGLPDAIGDLERGISRMEHELTDVALDVGRETLARLRPADHHARPFVAGQMDGASHDSVRAGLDEVQGSRAQRLYLAGFALGWNSRTARRAG